MSNSFTRLSHLLRNRSCPAAFRAILHDSKTAMFPLQRTGLNRVVPWYAVVPPMEELTSILTTMSMESIDSWGNLFPAVAQGSLTMAVWMSIVTLIVRSAKNEIKAEIAREGAIRDEKGHNWSFKLNEKLNNVDSKLNEKLNNLDSKMDEKLNNLDSKLNNVDSKLNEKLNNLDSKMDEKLNNLDSKMDEKLNDLDSKLNNVDSKLNEKLNNLDSKLDEKLKNLNLETKAALTEVKADLRIMDGKINTLNEKMDIWTVQQKIELDQMNMMIMGPKNKSQVGEKKY